MNCYNTLFAFLFAELLTTSCTLTIRDPQPATVSPLSSHAASATARTTNLQHSSVIQKVSEVSALPIASGRVVGSSHMENHISGMYLCISMHFV